MDKALQMISQHAEDGAKLRRDFFAVHGGKVAEAAGAWPSPWRAEARFCWRATAGARRMPSTGPRSSSTGS